MVWCCLLQIRAHHGLICASNTGCSSGLEVSKLKAAWIELDVEVYGPHGCETERQDIVLPLESVQPLQKDSLQWQDCPHASNVKTASIPSHLLTHLDSPVCCLLSEAVSSILHCSTASVGLCTTRSISCRLL